MKSSFSVLVSLLLATSAFGKELQGISAECSAKVFDQASQEFFAKAEASIRLRVAPAYAEHVQVGLTADTQGGVNVQILVAIERRGGQSVRAADGCQAIKLRKKTLRSTGPFGQLFHEIQSLEIPAMFPSALYLDATTYTLRIENRGGRTDLEWTGLDEPETLKKCRLCSWTDRILRLAR